MSKEQDILAGHLESLADNFDAFGVNPPDGQYPPRSLVYTTTVNGCAYTLIAPFSREGFLERAARLRKVRNDFGYTYKDTRVEPRRPPKNQAAYNERLYRQFLEDGEPENAQAYRDLYA